MQKYITVEGQQYRACSKCGGDGKYKMPGSPEDGNSCTACYGTGSLKLGTQRRIDDERKYEVQVVIDLKREIARCYKKIQAGVMPPVYRTMANEAWAKLLEKSQRMTLEEIKEIAESIEI